MRYGLTAQSRALSKLCTLFQTLWFQSFPTAWNACRATCLSPAENAMYAMRFLLKFVTP